MLDSGPRPAVFSEDRRYRYLLARRTGLSADGCLFIMLNPSTADETEDDPTIRRCMGFASRWGFGILVVANVFALRSTDPKGLCRVEDPIGPENDSWLLKAAKESDSVVCAWGNWGELFRRGDQVRAMLTDAGVPIQCLGVTGQGEPRHPLYLPKGQEMEELAA